VREGTTPRLRVNVWGPADEAEALSVHHDVHRVAEGSMPPDADLDLYHVADTPACAWIGRAARTRPGVLVLHDGSLHRLFTGSADAAGRFAYLDELRRTAGPAAAFVGRQVLLDRAGELWPELWPATEALLDASLAVVGASRRIADAARRRLPDRPVLWLPAAFRAPADAPTRAAARAALGIGPDALVILAPGPAAPATRLDAVARALEQLKADVPRAQLRVTGRLEGADLVRELIAADVVVVLRFPARARVPRAVIWAAGLGRPLLVSGATAAADEFPDGVVIAVDAGPGEDACLHALLSRLLQDAPLRAAVGRVAEAHFRAEHDPAALAARLAAFLADVKARKAELAARVAATQSPRGSLRARLVAELGDASRALGLRGVPPGVGDLMAPLT
jgi:glycosyltransferase involved in cell wall biosynthesis